MEKREYLVQLEIKGAEAIVQERVVFIQNDAASGRLRLLITMNSEPYPLEGLSGEIAFLRPDGKVIIGSLTFDERGAYYDVQSSELYCAGTVNISVNLYDSTSRLTCARFPIYVEQELDTSEAVDASLAYPTILEIINSLDSLETRAQGLEGRADTLEGRADDLDERASELEAQLTAGELTGDNAYEVAVKNGFEGTESQWLASLKGADGQDGKDGTDGINGKDGEKGADGANGDSAYEIAVKNGFEGTQSQWLASLKGADGANGKDGTNGEKGADGQDGADGRSPYLDENGQWVIYNDATGQYESTGVSAADSLHAVNIPTQSGSNVQSELDIIYSILPGSTLSANGCFALSGADAAALALPGSEQTRVTAYGQNLLFPPDAYVEGIPSLSTNSLDVSKAAQVNSLTSSLISFTPSALGHGVTFAFPGLPEGKYYLSLIPGCNISVSIYAKKTDGTFKSLNSTLGGATMSMSLFANIDATIAETYVVFVATTADTVNNPMTVTMFQLAKSDMTPSVMPPQRSVVIDTSASASPQTKLGIWPSWAIWGRAFQAAQLRVLSPISAN